MRKYPSLKSVKLFNLPEEENVHFVIQKYPNPHVKFPLIHQERTLDVLLNNKGFHFNSNLILGALLS